MKDALSLDSLSLRKVRIVRIARIVRIIRIARMARIVRIARVARTVTIARTGTIARTLYSLYSFVKAHVNVRLSLTPKHISRHYG